MLVMLLVAALTPFVVLTTRVAAGPNVIRDSPPSLSISKHWHTNVTGTFHPTQSDRRRFRNLIKGGGQRNSSALEVAQATPELTLNNTGIGYVAKVGFGSPPTYCESCQFLPDIVSYVPY
jgi:hypothetical protein